MEKGTESPALRPGRTGGLSDAGTQALGVSRVPGSQPVRPRGRSDAQPDGQLRLTWDCPAAC